MNAITLTVGNRASRLKPTYLFVAVHKGPYLTLAALEEVVGADNIQYLADGVCKLEREESGLPYVDLEQIFQQWESLENYLRNSDFSAVVRSTSEDVSGTNVEDLVSIAAQNSGTPLFVVEDFPGNYLPKRGRALNGLFTEAGPGQDIHRSRGVDPSLIHILSNPRYAALRDINKEKLREETRGSLGLKNETVMLWAGQPDGDNSYRALERLMQPLGRLGAFLLFRPHPRDEYYASGSYSDLLTGSGLNFLDVSSFADITGLICASDLVGTQFSSVAVEAGHLGIPPLFVMFPDLGQEYLANHKGYKLPPWSQDECSFLIEEEDSAEKILEQALFDQVSRDRVCVNFLARFGSTRGGAEAIIRHINRIMGQAIDETTKPVQV